MDSNLSFPKINFEGGGPPRIRHCKYIYYIQSRKTQYFKLKNNYIELIVMTYYGIEHPVRYIIVDIFCNIKLCVKCRIII